MNRVSPDQFTGGLNKHIFQFVEWVVDDTDMFIQDLHKEFVFRLI
jgi:hypothetical protein